MDLNNITLHKGQPEDITVTMSVNEALFIGLVLGKMNPNQGNTIMDDGGDYMNNIYFCLTREFFNRFWDRGIQGAKEGDEE